MNCPKLCDYGVLFFGSRLEDRVGMIHAEPAHRSVAYETEDQPVTRVEDLAELFHRGHSETLHGI